LKTESAKWWGLLEKLKHLVIGILMVKFIINYLKCDARKTKIFNKRFSMLHDLVSSKKSVF